MSCWAGRREEALPDAVVCVTDATNLGQHLRLLLELRQLGRPLILALNMMDIAQKRGCQIRYVEALSRQLGYSGGDHRGHAQERGARPARSDRYVAGPDPGQGR
jgi:hypothetical protein